MSDINQPSANAAHRVLARKYRPQNFSALYGQDALVRTLTNALQSGRIAQAYMLTGVRGVGKTTTARIIARALNCTGTDGTGGPTARPCGVCPNCGTIADDRHPDVLEMDAASRTGVGDIRELIDSVRYAPVQARNKVYIIDEVHMLSRQAFNALLKTLEEPPPHVKFIFATTEIRQVPVTVLSRCQRFDLRRINTAELYKLFSGVLEQEQVTAEEEAVRLIARAADGSARDGLSLLDQAIALSDTGIGTEAEPPEIKPAEIKPTEIKPGAKAAQTLQQQTLRAQTVRDMLGQADRGQLIDLFKALLHGRAAQVLDMFDAMYNTGSEPLLVIRDLSALSHLLTRTKVAPEATAKQNLPEMELALIEEVLDHLHLGVLGRLWQALQQGLSTMERAQDTKQAGDMVLMRLCHMANVPTPGETLKQLQQGTSGPAASQAPAPQTPAPQPSSVAQPPASQTPAPQTPEPQTPASQTPGGAPPDPGFQAGPIATHQAVSDTPLPEAPDLPEPPHLTDLAGVVAFLAGKKEARLVHDLSVNVRPVGFEPLPDPENKKSGNQKSGGRIVLHLLERAPKALPRRLQEALKQFTGRDWQVETTELPGDYSGDFSGHGTGAPTLHEQAQVREAETRKAAIAHPLVQSALSAFPQAELVAVRSKNSLTR